VNGDGRLYGIPLSAPRLTEIDTGNLHKLNNDHGISPDGATYALSDKTETGASAVYLMPVGSGDPKLLTKRDSSYFHGWSPDGQTLRRMVSGFGSTVNAMARSICGELHRMVALLNA